MYITINFIRTVLFKTTAWFVLTHDTRQIWSEGGLMQGDYKLLGLSYNRRIRQTYEQIYQYFYIGFYLQVECFKNCIFSVFSQLGKIFFLTPPVLFRYLTTSTTQPTAWWKQELVHCLKKKTLLACTLYSWNFHLLKLKHAHLLYVNAMALDWRK